MTFYGHYRVNLDIGRSTVNSKVRLIPRESCGVGCCLSDVTMTSHFPLCLRCGVTVVGLVWHRDLARGGQTELPHTNLPHHQPSSKPLLGMGHGDKGKMNDL